MKNLVLIASVSRDAGGLFESVRRLWQTLHTTQKMDVEVLSLADRHTKEDYGAWLPLRPRVFPVVGPGSFGYAPGLGRALAETKADILHENGLWMYPSVGSLHWGRRTQKPYVISAHGMLDPWAVRHSAWKKRLAGLLYENSHLRGAGCLRALCEPEARAYRQFGLKNPVCTIPNGIDMPEEEQTAPPPWNGLIPEGRKVLLYLGRIHPKKGIGNLLSAWAERRRNGFDRGRDWSLAIAGWDQGGHQEELRALAEECEASDVLFLGPLFGEKKKSAYAHADAFVLPSFSEGLPMAALEAWAYRLPVLMTPQCNLAEGFRAGAALRIDPEPGSIAQGLEELFEMSNAERFAMGEEGRRLVAERFSWPRIAADMKSVYEWLLGGGARPSQVEIA